MNRYYQILFILMIIFILSLCVSEMYGDTNNYLEPFCPNDNPDFNPYHRATDYMYLNYDPYYDFYKSKGFVAKKKKGNKLVKQFQPKHPMYEQMLQYYDSWPWKKMPKSKIMVGCENDKYKAFDCINSKTQQTGDLYGSIEQCRQLALKSDSCY